MHEARHSDFCSETRQFFSHVDAPEGHPFRRRAEKYWRGCCDPCSNGACGAELQFLKSVVYSTPPVLAENGAKALLEYMKEKVAPAILPEENNHPWSDTLRDPKRMVIFGTGAAINDR